jgi:hypothetical protein
MDSKAKIAETVVAAMKVHKGNALVHEWAVRALVSLADYTFNDNEVKVPLLHALPPCAKCMYMYMYVYIYICIYMYI